MGSCHLERCYRTSGTGLSSGGQSLPSYRWAILGAVSRPGGGHPVKISRSIGAGPWRGGPTPVFSFHVHAARGAVEPERKPDV